MGETFPSKIQRIFRLIQYLTEYPPKTVEKLASILNISIQTVYRDIKVLEDIGYDIDKDEHYRYKINMGNHYAHLNESEKKLIIGVLKSKNDSPALVNSIIQKLKLHHTTPEIKGFRAAKLLKIIQQLLQSIEYQLAVTLINYQSTSEGSATRDRTVLPLHFDENKLSITAYDFEKKMLRVFKLARIGQIEPVTIDNTEIMIKDIPILDTFGFAGSLDFEIRILLTKRSAAILAEEFPSVRQSVLENTDSNFPFTFSTKVCGYEGIGRFVLGLLTEIKVVDDEGFKKYLTKKIKEKMILNI